MGFPPDMFTVLFALARTVGWISQWNEMIEDPSQRIGRPRQLYVGAGERDYVPLTSAEFSQLKNFNAAVRLGDPGRLHELNNLLKPQSDNRATRPDF